MKKKFSGNRYKYSIEFVNNENEYYFQILCLYKKWNLKSTITNLNFIISELISPILGISDITNILSLKKIEAKKLISLSKLSFNNRAWVVALENSLDEDRALGGWNSDFKIWLLPGT